ncbi:MAG: response regulator transcription factor, partial [Anaerolineae bacterium]|nr:response regulator transcription factor [Anaerolineae bacterium]
RGLDAGADDYLVKPVRNKELLARVRANVRRARVPEQAPSKPIFRLNDLLIDFAQRQVVVRNQSVRLTPIEYKLLYHLAVNAGRILTHSQLLSKVWGPGYEEDTQYLWVNISRLRGKIEYEPSSPEYILTEPGVGYYLPDNEA